jgi:hypothetical protein
MSGLTTGQDLVSAMKQDEYRQAQMADILQRTEEAKTLAPYNLQAKQQAVAAAALEAKQKEKDYQTKVVGELIPKLEQIPGPARHAYMAQHLAAAGVPMDAEDVKWAQTHTGDELVQKLKKAHEWQVTQSPEYRKAMDVERSRAASAENVANINAKSRLDVASQKAARTAASIDQQAASGKLNYEKAAVAFSVMAMNADNLEDQQKFQEKAAQYEKLANNLRASQNVGKPDIGAATGLPTQQMPSVLGTGATPPANAPAAPGLPPGWVQK